MVKAHLICGASRLQILLLSSGTPKQFVPVKTMREWKVCEVWDLDGCALKQNTMDSDWEEQLTQALPADRPVLGREGTRG